MSKELMSAPEWIFMIVGLLAVAAVVGPQLRRSNTNPPPKGQRPPKPPPGPPLAPMEYTVVPVLDSFDSAKVIGELRILTAALPPAPEFSFSLGYRVLEKTDTGDVRRYELLCVSRVPDSLHPAARPQPPSSRIIKEGDAQ